MGIFTMQPLASSLSAAGRREPAGARRSTSTRSPCGSTRTWRPAGNVCGATGRSQRTKRPFAALRGAPSPVRAGRGLRRARCRRRRAGSGRRASSAARCAVSVSSSRARARCARLRSERRKHSRHGRAAALGTRLAQVTSCPPGGRKDDRRARAALADLRVDRGGTSLRSAAAARPTQPASPPRPTSGVDGCRCRRASSRRWMRRSAGRPASTAARQESRRRLPLARAHGDRPRAARHAPPAQRLEGMAEVVKTAARGRAALGAPRRRARPPLRRLQGGDLPARPARP